jgi:hypothetical protein
LYVGSVTDYKGECENNNRFLYITLIYKSWDNSKLACFLRCTFCLCSSVALSEVGEAVACRWPQVVRKSSTSGLDKNDRFFAACGTYMVRTLGRFHRFGFNKKI